MKKGSLYVLKLYVTATYILFLLLPLSVLLIFIPRFFNFARERAISSMEENLNKTGYVLDLTFGEIDRMVDQVQYFPDFDRITTLEKPRYGESVNPWQLVLFQKMFRPMAVQNALIYHYFLVTYPNGFILNNSQIFTDLDFFYTYIFHYKEWTRREWEEQILFGTGSRLIQEKEIYLNSDGENAKETKHMVTYVRSVILNNGRKDPHRFSVFFLLDEQYLIELLRFSQQNGRGSVTLLDNQGRILASANREESLSASDFAIMMNNQAGEIVLNGRKCLFSTRTSSTHGFVLLSFIPLEELFREIYTFSRILLFMLILVLSAGTITAWILSSRQYRSISRTLQLLDLDNLKEVRVSEVYQVLNDRIARRNLDFLLQKDRIGTLHIRMLLNGEWEDSPQRERILENLDLQPNTICRTVLVNPLPTALPPHEQRLPPCQLTDEFTALIYTGKSADSLIEEDLKELDHLYGEEGCLLIASIGPLAKELSELPFSYRQARKGFTLAGPLNRIIRPEVEREENHLLNYPMELETRLINATLAGNKKVLADIFNILFRDNGGILRESAEARERFCGQLVGTYARFLEMSGMEGREVLQPYRDSSPEELKVWIGNYFLSAAESREMAKHSHNEELLVQIDRYIDDHFSDIMMNGQAIAAHSGISVTYLSTFLKEQRGISYGKLLENRRMKEAENLLIESNDRIGDIARKCGYDNAGSFRRRFKAVFGLSPGEYRIGKKG